MPARRLTPKQTERAEAEDAAAQEAASVAAAPPPPPARIGVQAPSYIRAKHPDHGEPVVFVPGELLPEWAAEKVKAGKAKVDADGVMVLP